MRSGGFRPYDEETVLTRESRQKSATFFTAPISGALILGLAGFLNFCASGHGLADDTPTFSIEFHDGKIAPLRLEVQANKRFRIELHNTGVTAAEFESSDLHLEKVLAPNNPSPPPVLVIHSLDPGQYIFFDDLHADAPKIILDAK